MYRLGKYFLLFVSLVLVVTTSQVAQAYELHDGPTGVTKYTKGKAFEGYTLFTPTESNRTIYLINMEGDLVHSWTVSEGKGNVFNAQLLPNGNVLVLITKAEKPVNIGGASGLLEELDWDGNVVWSYTMCSDSEVAHHAFDRMPNGNTLVLGWEKVSGEEMIKKGRDPKTVPTKPIIIRGQETSAFWVDFAREVDPAGKTVWEWHLKDHIGTGPNQLDINYTLPEKVGTGYDSYDWSHFNTLEYVPATDQVIMNSRNFSEVYIIDKKTGNIVQRWGNPSTHGKGARPSWFDDGSQIIFGSHHATMLENGNISIFDNGSERAEGQRSRVIEVNLKTGKIVWEYAACASNSFFSIRQGAAQRLPNGNTLVTSTQQGHLFEVTPDKNVVWEFVSPIIKGQNQKMFSDARDTKRNPKGEPVANASESMIHRAYRYAPEYPGLKGKKLESQGYIVKDGVKYFELFQKD